MGSLATVEESSIQPEVAEEERAVAPPPKPLEPKPLEFDATALLPTAGTVKLTDEQEAVLYAPVDELAVEIRPDEAGLIYLPWMEYMTRLKEAFGMEWAMIPKGLPKKSDGMMYWGFYLVVQGCFAGFSVGEQKYPTGQMTYGDAAESAKSNALMRLCKGIGITIELWKPSFIRGWKEKYAETYQDKGKTKWRKKKVQGYTAGVDVIPEDEPPKEEVVLTEDKLDPDKAMKMFVGLSAPHKAEYKQTFPGKFGDLTLLRQQTAMVWLETKVEEKEEG